MPNRAGKVCSVPTGILLEGVSGKLTLCACTILSLRTQRAVLARVTSVAAPSECVVGTGHRMGDKAQRCDKTDESLL